MEGRNIQLKETEDMFKKNSDLKEECKKINEEELQQEKKESEEDRGGAEEAA